MLYQGALYHHHTPSGKLEEILWFIVSMVHWVAVMSACYLDAQHQGQQQMLCLLHHWFWWPGMATQMQKVISSMQIDASSMKAVIQKSQCDQSLLATPLGVATGWPYQHWDHYGVGSTAKCGEPFGLLWPLYMKHIMAYVTPNKTAKTAAKFLWQGYISILGALAKLLSNQGANF